MVKKGFIILTVCILSLTIGIAHAEEVIAWTFQTGDMIFTNPVAHENVIYFGSLDGVFYAVDAASGEEVWHYTTQTPIQSTAAVFENGICFESGNVLIALDFTGSLLWQKSLFDGPANFRIDTWDFVHSSPNIVDGVVYIGTERGWVYGIDVNTGEETFKVQTSNQGTIRTTPVIEGTRLYVGDWDGFVNCFDIESGNLLWQYDTHVDVSFEWTNAIQTPLLVQDGVIYFAGRSCRAYALDALTGEKKWMLSQGNVWVVGGTVISDSLVYFGSSNQSLIYALQIQDGNSRWQKSIDFRMWNCPLVSGDYLFFGSRSFYVMDKTTGDVVNKLYFNPDSVHREPVHIYYWAADYYGGAADIANFHSSAIEVDGKIIVGCDDGRLYAFRREELINLPKSETSVNSSYVLLGDVPNDTTLSVDIELTNTGDKADEVSLSTSNTLLANAVTFDQELLNVPAGGSTVLHVSINTSDLKPKAYTLTLILNSKYNIENSRMTKTIRFKVVAATAVDEQYAANPEAFVLNPNFPNPFNPATQITYALPSDSDVTLSVFDLRGRRVSDLVRERQSAGNYSVTFDGNDISSGVYVCVLEAGAQRLLQKMMLLK